MNNQLLLRRPRYPQWSAAALILTLIVLTPYVPLVVGPLVRGAGESWYHIRTTVLGRYAVNTALLLIASVIPAAFLGVVGAWITERYEFRGRRLATFLYAAPLALPAYVATYTWAQILGFGGIVQRTTGLTVPFAGVSAAGAVLAFGLYPYVYLTVRAALAGNARTLIEAVASLTPSGGRRRYAARLLRGVLPTLWPAITGGAFLVAMEVMNAYATPIYLGVPTLSTGVFRTWFGLGDLATATTLASLVLLTMLVLTLVERALRGRRRFSGGTGAPPARLPLSGSRALVAWVLLAVPVLFGFALPLAQIVSWAASRSFGTDANYSQVLATTARTVLLAGAATLLIVTVALIISYARHLSRSVSMIAVARLAAVGYTVPGTVVAIGVLAVFASLREIDSRLFLFGTIAGLLFAYVARYLAVALQPIEGAFARRHRSVVDAARSLGRPPSVVLTRVVLPMFRPTLAGAALLVAIDVVKDLPMTLLLRPFDFDTLAIEVYALASDERMADAAPAALLLVIVGLLAILSVMAPTLRRRRRG